MKNKDLSQYLSQAEQPVKDFMATILENFGEQLSNQKDPVIALEYFGASMEIRLKEFEGVYRSKEGEPV